MKRPDIDHIANSILAEPAAQRLRESGLRDFAHPQPDALPRFQKSAPEKAHGVPNAQEPVSQQGAPTKGRAKGWTGALCWSIAGFAAGAVFWHLVGFWDFMSDVVLNEKVRPEIQARLVAGTRAQLQRRQRLKADPASFNPARSTGVGPAAKDCRVLSVDRRTGKTRPVPCPGEPPRDRKKTAAQASTGVARGSEQKRTAGAADWAAVVAPVDLSAATLPLPSQDDQPVFQLSGSNVSAPLGLPD